MEIKIIEDAKNKAMVQISGEDYTLCGAIKDELWNDKHVKAAGYHVKHPLVGVPTLIIETDGNEKPMAALNAAITRLGKVNEKFIAEFKKGVR